MTLTPPSPARRAALAVALLAAAGCATSTPSTPPVVAPATTALDGRLDEARAVLTTVAEKQAALDFSGMAGQVAGPVKVAADYSATLNTIEAYLAVAEPKKKTAKVDLTRLTGLRRGDAGRLLATGEVTVTDDETATWTDIELVDEGGLRLWDFRTSKTGLKASEAFIAGGAKLANDDVEAELLSASCTPPGTTDPDSAAVVLLVAYTAKGEGRVTLTSASLKPKGGEVASLELGRGDPTRPQGPAHAVLAFTGTDVVTEGTLTLIFTETESTTELPPLTLRSPAFPDAAACETAV